jgi:hypothetical protein
MKTETQRALAIGNFTERHLSISDEFVERITELLKDEHKKLVTYGITENYERKESVRFEYDNGFRLDVSLTRG